MIHEQLKNYPAAESYMLRALTLCEKLFGGTYLTLASRLCLAGQLYNKQFKFDTAKPLFLRALKIKEGAQYIV